MKLVYVLMWIALLTIGTVLLKHHKKMGYSRWMGISLIVASCGSFGVSMRTSMLPFLEAMFHLPDIVSDTLITLSIVTLTIYFYTLPYFAVVLALYFTDLFTASQRKLLGLVLIASPAATIFIQWTKYGFTDLHTSMNRYWTLLYLLFALVLHVQVALTERNPLLKKNKTRIANVFGLAIVWMGITDFWDIYRIRAGYGDFEISSTGLWQFNIVIIGWVVVFFIYYSLRYGFLGIKLLIEQERYDFSMRTLTMGTSILNHSIKNELQKIDYLAERAREAVKGGNDEIAQQAMTNLYSVTDHMMNMVARIKQKADDFTLNEKQESLQGIITETVFYIRPMLQDKSITIIEEPSKPIMLVLDGTHIRETLHNVLTNAVEAMRAEGGVIRIRIIESNRWVTLSVEDNGTGIDKQLLHKVAEPFFTTKRKPMNYGLGLSYCKSVMQKHGGFMDIHSEKGKGTIVSLHLPVKRKVTEHSRLSG